MDKKYIMIGTIVCALLSATGYTAKFVYDMGQEIGELRAEVKYQTQTIQTLSDEYGILSEKCN